MSAALAASLQSADQRLRLGAQGFVETGLANFLERCQAAGGGHRVAGQGARLVHRAQGGQVLHHRAFAAKGRQRHATANDLAQHRHVGLKAGNAAGVHRLCAAECYAKAGHNFVKNEQCAVLGAQLAAAFHKRHAGAHKVHVAGDRLDHHAGEVFAVQGKGFFKLLHIVVFQHQRVLHHFGRHTRAGGVAKGGQAGAGFHEEGIRMAVVATFELQNLAAPGGAARQADGTHAGFGAAADQGEPCPCWAPAPEWLRPVRPRAR